MEEAEAVGVEDMEVDLAVDAVVDVEEASEEVEAGDVDSEVCLFSMIKTYFDVFSVVQVQALLHM